MVCSSLFYVDKINLRYNYFAKKTWIENGKKNPPLSQSTKQ